MNNPKDKTVADQGKPSGGKPSRFSRRKSESPRDRRFRRGTSKRQRRRPPAVRFEGATTELKSNSFHINYNQAKQYNKTIKSLCEYVCIRYKNGADVRVSIDNLQEIVPDIPEEPSNPSALEKRI